MFSKKTMLGIGLAGAMGFGVLAAPAFAITVNPFDPNLPLDRHASALCGDVLTDGGTQATCAATNPVENPATLSQVVGTSAGTADLRTGTLRSRSTAQALWFGNDNIRAGGGSIVQLYDTITIGGGFTGTVELRMLVDGSFFTAGGARPDSLATTMRAQLFEIEDVERFDAARALVTVFQYGSGEVELGQQSTNGLGAITTNASGNRNWFDPANVQVGLSLFFPVTPTNPEFSFLARLGTGSGLNLYGGLGNQVQEAATDFGNTAQLALIVPEGVTWNSASGAFLVPAPVPIPAAAWLFASGLLGLIGIARRNKK